MASICRTFNLFIYAVSLSFFPALAIVRSLSLSVLFTFSHFLSYYFPLCLTLFHIQLSLSKYGICHGLIHFHHIDLTSPIWFAVMIASHSPASSSTSFSFLFLYATAALQQRSYDDPSVK